MTSSVTVPTRLVVAGGAAAGSLLAYAHVVEPRWLKTERWTVRIPDLPDAWEGLRVAHLTDFEMGMWLQSGALVRRAVERAIALRPDIVYLTGDFTHDGRWPASAAGLLRPLTRMARVFAVLGNHDHTGAPRNAQAVAEGLRREGVTVLMNEHAPFDWRGHCWMVVGVDDFATGHSDLLRASTGIPRGARLLTLLTHVPEAAEYAPEGWFPLMVAGHTHGAQVRITPLHRLARRLGYGDEYALKHTSGWFDVAGGLMYVNRGIGLSLLPLRLAARPEVALFVLTGGRALPEGVRWRRGEPPLQPA